MANTHVGEEIAEAKTAHFQASAQARDCLDSIARRVREDAPPETAPVAGEFVHAFYAALPAKFLTTSNHESLFAIAKAQWRFMQERVPGTAKVRVYNPSSEIDGWESPYTVVAMLNDDMPFIIDSITAYLTGQQLAIHRLIHPVLKIERDADGKLTNLKGSTEDGDRELESCVLLEIDLCASENIHLQLEGELIAILEDVRAVTADWKPIIAQLAKTVALLQTDPPPGVPENESGEAVAFMNWMANNHFTFLGYREYSLDNLSESEFRYQVTANSGLGVLRNPAVRPLGAWSDKLPPEALDIYASPSLLIITKSTRRSKVHRNVAMDSVGVKIHDADGQVCGERRFLGLFTSAAYNCSVSDIPLLRRKIDHVLAASEFTAGSHNLKALQHVVESLPRDELFQISEENLLTLSLGVIDAEVQQQTRLFIRRDPFERFVSCLVYLSRDRYNTDLRERIEAILESTFAGISQTYAAQVGDSPLARLHYIVETTPGKIPNYDSLKIEARIAETARSWRDQLNAELGERFDGERQRALFQCFRDAFPIAYREDFSALTGAEDVIKIEQAAKGDSIAMNLYRLPDDDGPTVNFKIYRAGAPIPLSDLLPSLENMGLRVISERPYSVRLEGTEIGAHLRARGQLEAVWVHDLTMTEQGGQSVDIHEIRDIFHEAFARIWARDVEDDGFNHLVVCSGLDWRGVAILRAISKFLRQAGIPFSQPYMEETLARNASISALLAEYFVKRFDPRGPGESNIDKLRSNILAALDGVSSLDEDRILRRFLNVVDSAVRTNYFQKSPTGEAKSYLSIKLDSRQLEELPAPRPLFEIFVYSPRVEGVHLRGGKVARGGIRWSDRREDFRTEVLGLMKAQMVKNAVIVPVGAKGGFVVKCPPLASDELRAEAIECYKIFISGLLDLTDNRQADVVVPPADVVRYDSDDPYLVVAADKGTASFSDIANELALDYGFWLGDAFASGGRDGYDHKKMGITARGAWESVKRHFRELSRDIQSEDFTVVGVGDMSGDVFGNGMLQSEHILLLAAFNHRQIFVDPHPDAKTSFRERRRLFREGSSDWSEYQALSPGGFIAERSAKSVALAPNVRAWLGIEEQTLTPNQLISALLRAPADLLWFGGIGCFVRAGRERDEEIGDRVNASVRVRASEIRCRVIGEGANLALTQAARIEFAAAGGKINSDAVDNSAGVDCSDHEVNIKIALSKVTAEGTLTLKNRNTLLHRMTDEVAALVLRDNYLQSQAISIEAAHAPERLDSHARLMRSMERAGRLDRIVEGLPDEDTIDERASAGQGLTRPEIALLLAYAKMALFENLLESDVPEDTHLDDDLALYFPAPLRAEHRAGIEDHRLRREIISSSIANSLINRAGVCFVSEMAEESACGQGDVARAYVAARRINQLRRNWQAIEALDNRIESAVQLDMFAEFHKLLVHHTSWLLRNRPRPLDISRAIDDFGAGIGELEGQIESVLSPAGLTHLGSRQAKFGKNGVADGLARLVASVDAMIPACDIVEVSRQAALPVDKTAAVYFQLGARFGLEWLRDDAAPLLAGDHWQQRAVAAIIEDLYSQQRALCRTVLSDGAHLSPEDAVENWVSQNQDIFERSVALFDDLKSAGPLDLAKLALANRHMRELILA
ncbi:MAG: NAD-glutamate dehydrogenase [Proteobacteria bacterium]|nr:NAD-glutamate dehydrogenase [Pseudomonadota bacterium]MDA1357764.1 NAD-glutamate dehydrogenase [Pseudomonadota bacterium]